MGGVSREKGILKLVYPGGSVEIYKEATRAADVMKRNPRHCITRPDVFKYPWIVVRPESILTLGRVFFVVPYHTIRRLLQSNGIMAKTPPTDHKHKHKQRVNANCDVNDMWASEDAIQVDEDKILHERTRIQSQRRKNVSHYEYKEDNERRRHVNSSDNIQVLSKVAKENENPRKDVDEKKKKSREISEERKKRHSTANWPLKKIPSTRTYPIHENRIRGDLFEDKSVEYLIPCLKKPGSTFVSEKRNLKVTFMIPAGVDESGRNFLFSKPSVEVF